MSEMIKCPECNHEFELSEVLKKDIQASVELDFQKKLKSEVAKAKLEASKDAEKDIRAIEENLEETQKKLDEAKDNELKLRKQAQTLIEREKSLNLEVERKLDEERNKIADKVAKETQDSHRLKDAEKDKKIADALAQVEELKRKMEQGSQQAQGEVLEVELETILKAEFPFDVIEEVAKGVKGGDLLQTVKSKTGEEAGKILWELKRTKNFSQLWLDKIKSDARNAKASVCILATETMPNGVEYFSMIEGVWVVSLKDCVPLSRVLRFGLTQVAKEKMAQSGKKEKAEVMYDYLIGIEFKGRLEALVEAYKAMKEDLDSERRSMEKIWAKREKTIGMVTLNLAGMHGELESLAGDSLPSIQLLELS